jgi:hypothetical protein
MDREVVLAGIKIIEEEAMITDQHFLTGAAKGSLKRIAKSFEEKKKRTESELSSASNASKTQLQEEIKDYETIVTSVNESLERIGKKNSLKKN